jgi:hypothetical protein
LTNLTLEPASIFRLAPRSGTAVIQSLTIAGGEMPTATFDLTDNAVVIDYEGASPVSGVRAQLLTGRGATGLGGSWSGTGITSSTAAADNAFEPDSRSVGYAENSMLPLGPYTSFRGQTVDGSSVLLAFTRTGDANLDGVVDDADVTIVSAAYAPGVPQPHWALGDFDFNGFVDDGDVTLLGVFYDPNAAPLLALVPAATGVASVPEPSSLAAVIVLLGVLMVRALGQRWSARRR